MSETTVNRSERIVVSHDVHYRTPREEKPPLGVKLSILGRGGVQSHAEWRDDVGFIAWAPLTKTSDSVKRLRQACYRYPAIAQWNLYRLPRDRVLEEGSQEESEVLLGIIEQTLGMSPTGEVFCLHLVSEKDPVRWMNIYQGLIKQDGPIGERARNVQSKIREYSYQKIEAVNKFFSTGERQAVVCMDVLSDPEVARSLTNGIVQGTGKVFYVHYRNPHNGLELVWTGPGVPPEDFFRLFE